LAAPLSRQADGVGAAPPPGAWALLCTRMETTRGGGAGVEGGAGAGGGEGAAVAMTGGWVAAAGATAVEGATAVGGGGCAGRRWSPTYTSHAAKRTQARATRGARSPSLRTHMRVIRYNDTALALTCAIRKSSRPSTPGTPVCDTGVRSHA
jgi:hypothetical protein